MKNAGQGFKGDNQGLKTADLGTQGRQPMSQENGYKSFIIYTKSLKFPDFVTNDYVQLLSKFCIVLTMCEQEIQQ